MKNFQCTIKPIEKNNLGSVFPTTSVARFIGGMFDFFTNRDRAINVDINGNSVEVPTLTEKLEDLAERAVPYDRTQPGFEMLQVGTDLVVGGTGAYMMGGPIRRGAPNTTGMGAIQEVESAAQRSLQGLAEERAFLEEVNQPAYRSGVGSRNRQINSDRVIHVRSDNPNHLVFNENGRTKVISFVDLSEAGTLKCKGEVSKAGRALQKKAGRLDSAFPKPTGKPEEVSPEEVSLQGQKVLDEILNHPNRVITFERPPTLKFETIDIMVPGKGGVRFTKDGKIMIGFLEPQR